MNSYSDDLFKVGFYKKWKLYSPAKTNLLQAYSDWFWFLQIETNIFKTATKSLCHSRVCAKKLPPNLYIEHGGVFLLLQKRQYFPHMDPLSEDDLFKVSFY